MHLLKESLLAAFLELNQFDRFWRVDAILHELHICTVQWEGLAFSCQTVNYGISDEEMIITNRARSPSARLTVALD